MLRFVYGASGAGKSTRVYNEIIRRASEAPDGRFLILVPDQFTMQVQQEVVRLHPKHALMNIDVLSFSRLIHRVFSEAGYPQETLLDDLGKTLILRRLASKMAKELPLIAKGMRGAGYADEVKSTLSELLQYDISPAGMEALIAGSAGRPHLQRKLTELQKLYAAFLEHIENRYRTAEDSLTACARRVKDCRFLKDTVIVFDGFTGFTPVQYGVIKELLKASSEVIVTVTVADAAQGAQAVSAEALREGGEDALFALSLQTIRQFTRCAYDAEKERAQDSLALPPFAVWAGHRAETAGDVLLPETPVARLKDNEALSFLERKLFRAGGERFAQTTDAVHLRIMSTPKEEVRQTFRTIRRLLREDASLQYRDIAIICADPAAYTQEILNVAADFDIPVYEDRTNSLSVNPLMEYLRGILECVRTNFSAVSVFHVLRSGMTGETSADIDLTEVYVRAAGVRGRKQWSGRFTRRVRDGIDRTEEERLRIDERIDGVRSRFAAAMAALLAAFDTKGNVRTVLTALYDMMRAHGVQEKLERHAEDFAKKGDRAKEQYYRQTFPKVIALFETIEALMGDEVLPAKEIAEILETGFQGVTIGSLPQSADRVMTGDTERTRLREVKLLFLLGAGDSAIPKRDSGGGFLSESDRLYLKEAAPEVMLAPTPAEQMYIQRLYLYMILTKPTRALYLSYAARSGDSGSERPSFLFAALEALFPALETERPEQDALLAQAESRKDIRHRMARGMRAYADGLVEEEEAECFLTVYRSLMASGDVRDQLIRSAAFFRYRGERLPEALAAQLYEQPLTGSVSRLELFAACAFAHFMRYGLRVKERETDTFDVADLGTVYHAVLERFSDALAEEGRDLRDVTDAHAEEIITQALSAYAAEKEAAHLAESVRGRMLQQRIRRVLMRTVKTLRFQTAKGAFRQVSAEQRFLREVEQDGKTIRLKGSIDRVEYAEDEEHTYVKIVDFKSGRNDFEPVRLLHGLQLQLMLYMEAALREAEKKMSGKSALPAAMLYYQVKDPMIHTDEGEEKAEDEILKNLRPTGLVNADEAALALLEPELSGTSRILPVSKKNDGSFRDTSDVFTTEEYALLTKNTAARITRMGEEMAEGEIAVSPALTENRDACAYCAYRSACGFDETQPGYAYREFPAMKMKDVIERCRKS